jgi:hypothetical protein
MSKARRRASWVLVGGVADHGDHQGGIGEFYQEHAGVIESHRIPTLDFTTGKPTHRLYSRAKVIDMIFFRPRHGAQPSWAVRDWIYGELLIPACWAGICTVATDKAR